MLIFVGLSLQTHYIKFILPTGDIKYLFVPLYEHAVMLSAQLLTMNECSINPFFFPLRPNIKYNLLQRTYITVHFVSFEDLTTACLHFKLTKGIWAALLSMSHLIISLSLALMIGPLLIMTCLYSS